MGHGPQKEPPWARLLGRSYTYHVPLGSTPHFRQREEAAAQSSNHSLSTNQLQVCLGAERSRVQCVTGQGERSRTEPHGDGAVCWGEVTTAVTSVFL
eukprot:6212483-Pleurochrysis_carterae.AAC.5